MTRDDWIASFEEEGEHKVRIKVAASQINHDGLRVAVDWLAEKDRQSERNRKARSRIELMLAIVAAIAAIVAAVAAVMTLILSA